MPDTEMLEENPVPALLCSPPGQNHDRPEGIDWSPEEVEELIRATNLCAMCCPIFGPDPTEDDGEPRRHHTSHETLLQSVNARCLICTMLYERWKRYSESPERLSLVPRDQHSERVSFYFVRGGDKVYLLIGPSQGVIDYLESGSSEHLGADILLCFRLHELSTVSRKDIVLQPQTQPSQCMTTAASWMNRCLNEDHRECQDVRQRSGRHRPKPSRLLYIDTDQDDAVKLVSVAEEKNYLYVTLSHRWGFPEPPKLSDYDDPGQPGKVYIRTLEAGIEISNLPRTFREAIYTVKHCGLSYIWIDCLCIIQDINSEGQNPDWEKEAGKMADIYAGGVFNIAVTNARDSEAGIFPTRRYIAVPAVRDLAPQSSAQQVWLLVEEPSEKFERDIVSSELLSRGWVYQEVFLTPANLFCTADEMWWSCFHLTYTQTLPGGADFKDSIQYRKTKIMFDGHGPREAWRSVLEFYTGTSVTFKGDRLVAIAGLVKLFRAVYPDHFQHASYHSGVWPVFLRRSLDQVLWRRSKGQSLPSHRYSSTHPIPSWSPASYDGKIRWPNIMALELPEFININSSHLDSFGRAMSQAQCTLHLRGVLVKIDIAVEDQSTKESWASVTGLEDRLFVIEWDSDYDRRLAAELSRRDYARALICSLNVNEGWSVEGVILRPLDDPLHTDDPITWIRCGYIHYLNPKLMARKRDVGESLQLERYGLIWTSYQRLCTYTGEYYMEGRWVGSPNAPTPTPTDLEDIYIV